MHTCRCYCASIAVAVILVIIVGNISLYYYLFHGAKTSYVTKIHQMRLLNSTYLPNYYNLTKLTIEKYNESASIVNFEGEVFIDLDESVYLQVDMYHSKPNTTEYDQWSFHLPNMTICTYNLLYYKHFLMEKMKNISNFPQFGSDDSTCIKKVSDSGQIRKNRLFFMWKSKKKITKCILCTPCIFYHIICIRIFTGKILDKRLYHQNNTLNGLFATWHIQIRIYFS